MSIYVDGKPGRILMDLLALRRKVGVLQAEKKAGVPYAVKSAKDLMIKLRDAGDELGMPMCGSVVHSVVTGEFPSDRGTKLTVTSTVRFMSSDGSYVDFTGVGGGMAPDDKGAGKAHTYSWKTAVVTGLQLPDREMVDCDDEQLLDHVYELTQSINRCTALADLKGLGAQLNALKDHEKAAIGPVYIRKMGELKGT